MKINKKIHKQLMKNLKEWKVSTIEDIDEVLGKIQKCNTSVEALMKLKAELIFEVLTSVPLSPDVCYFCIKQQDYYKHVTCEKCIYGKSNRECHDENSSYQILHKKLNNLKKDYYIKYPKFKVK